MTSWSYDFSRMRIFCPAIASSDSLSSYRLLMAGPMDLRPPRSGVSHPFRRYEAVRREALVSRINRKAGRAGACASLAGRPRDFRVRTMDKGWRCRHWSSSRVKQPVHSARPLSKDQIDPGSESPALRCTSPCRHLAGSPTLCHLVACRRLSPSSRRAKERRGLVNDRQALKGPARHTRHRRRGRQIGGKEALQGPGGGHGAWEAWPGRLTRRV